MPNRVPLMKITECDNIIKALKSFSDTKEIPISELDFILNSVSIFIKEDEKGEFRKALESDLANLKNLEYLLNPNLKITQRYDIDIVRALHDTQKPKILLAANKNLTKAYAVIKFEESKYFEGIEQYVYEEILKLKARNDFIILEDDISLKRDINEYCRFLKNGQQIDDFRIAIGLGVDSKPTIDASIEYRYLKNALGSGCEPNSPNEANCLIPVKKDQVLIVYHKPSKGDNWRNCKGEFFLAQEPLESVKIDFEIDNTIRKNENSATTEFIGLLDGFLRHEKGRYTITKELELGDISLANTGSIIGDLNSETTLKVGSIDSTKDSVGEGITIKVPTVQIEGNLGSNTTITANTLIIHGQSHKSSKLQAKDIEIEVHRGVILGERVEIGRLEHGIVEAGIVRVEKMMGGVIKAREVYIEELLSNSEVYASKLIEISQIKGEENRLYIDPGAYYKDKIEIDLLKEQKDGILKELHKLQGEYKKLAESLNRSKNTIEQIVNEIKNLKSQNQKPPKIYVERVNNYKTLLNEAKDISLSLESKKRDLQSVETKIKRIQSESENGRVVCHSFYKGYNEVHFLQLEPKNDFLKKPQGKMTELKLVQNEDGTKEIKAF